MSAITADFRRAALRHEVVVRPKSVTNPASEALTYAAVLEMANYGYRVIPDDLHGMSVKSLTSMLSDARAIKGADRDMAPIYPGFPKQVQELSTLTLLIEQIMHYWTAGAFLPNHPHVIREGLPLEDMVVNVQKVQVLEAGPAARYLVSTLTSRGVSLSDAERELLRGGVSVAAPDTATVKDVLRISRNGENTQVLMSALVDSGAYTPSDIVREFASSMHNVDQLLRLVLAAVGTPSDAHREAGMRAITALSDKDTFAVHMGSLSRAARRELMSSLGSLTEGFYADRLVNRSRLWRRVMRGVHPYAQIELSEAARRAADIIHGNVEYRTLDALIEEAIREGDSLGAIDLMVTHRPGALLTRTTELLRLPNPMATARTLASAITNTASTAPVSTLIRAYNAVLSANFDGARVVREAGRTNRMMDVQRSVIRDKHLNVVLDAIRSALSARLATAGAPRESVGINSSMGVPLVRRDLSNTDRVLDRGTRLAPAGEGGILRFFCHWVNHYHTAGFVDIGVVLLNESFDKLVTTTWNTWNDNRTWSTYSGDKLVEPGDSAAEFFDIDVAAARKLYKTAKWAVMSMQSYSGIPLSDTDSVAGTMFRSDADKGEVFDARTVTSAFSPTTAALQALPLAVDLDTLEMVWLDTSSGSCARGVSASNDSDIGPVVRDEIARPRLTMGELASLWAAAHGADIDADATVDRDAVLALLD